MSKAACVLALLAGMASVLPALAIERTENSGAPELATPLTVRSQGKDTHKTSGIRDTGSGPNQGVATTFHCTSESSVQEKLEFLLRNFDGRIVSDQAFIIDPASTFTASTHTTSAFVEDAVLSPGVNIAQGAAVIISTTSQIVCSVMIVDASAFTPVGISLHLQRFHVLPGTEE